jgi:hypothetical protein
MTHDVVIERPRESMGIIAVTHDLLAHTASVPNWTQRFLARPSQIRAMLRSQASPFRSRRSPALFFLVVRASTELGYDFDLANDGIVERSKVFSRNPVPQMIFSPTSRT